MAQYLSSISGTLGVPTSKIDPYSNYYSLLLTINIIIMHHFTKINSSHIFLLILEFNNAKKLL
jgi:hypothetical protein